MKFTFKKHAKERGLRAVGNPYQDVDIKLKGKLVGMIYAPSWQTADHKWSIGFVVNDPPTQDEPCPFAWKKLKQRFDSEDAAREFITKNAEDINSKFDLYLSYGQ